MSPAISLHLIGFGLTLQLQHHWTCLGPGGHLELDLWGTPDLRLSKWDADSEGPLVHTARRSYSLYL